MTVVISLHIFGKGKSIVKQSRKVEAVRVQRLPDYQQVI